MKNARSIAVLALLKVNNDDGYSNLVLDGYIRENKLLPREAAFSTALFYGVLERKITLDGIISRYSKTPLRKLDPQVREVLRIALYQLLYMDGVPESAAVNESVKLCRELGKSSASGFVNGVLRTFLREGKPIIDPKKTPTEDQRLSLLYSCPPWLVQAFRRDYGEESLLSMLEASLGKPPLYLRVNTARITQQELMAQLEGENITVTEDLDLEGCLRVEGTGDITRLKSYQEGLFHVQDKASQLCCKALAAEPGQRVLDLCAAPGGKSFTLAQRMENQGELIACDLYESRTRLIAQGAERLGLTSIKPMQRDATQWDVTLGYFDRVLCDVPCSGLGIIRRKPEIKYKDPVEFETLPDYQYKILENAANYVDEGGILVYSTCTLSPRENQEVIRRLLEEHREFVPVPLAGLGLEEYSTTLLPQVDGTDGFFISAVRRV